LFQEIASYLGVDLGKILIKRFADGEIYLQLQESVRGCNVFLVQPTCSPVNENLMELFIMIDAYRWASARSITVVNLSFRTLDMLEQTERYGQMIKLADCF
jgi:ribose-phosphate pyrophosphokinase